ncbi:MAG: hypothetical protein LBL61_01095 [Elusimicrobiota bacterium]|jgi:hypothetical protein|nr:hypothetical protein [Elusimicrobiota bacterium]
MKQLLIILLLAGGGYYIYHNGFLKVLSDIKLSPKEFVSDIKGAASSLTAQATDGLPARAAERTCPAPVSKENFTALESAAFTSRNSKAAYALAEMAYGLGMEESESVINKYLAAFTRASEKNRILTLITKYKDKESLDMLNKFFIRGVFARKTLMRKIADYKTPEAAEVIQAAVDSKTAALRAAALEVYEEVKNEPWYTSGIQKKSTLAAQHTNEIYNIPLN